MPVAAIFNQKAARWVRGRRGQFEKLRAAIGDTRNIVWIHCASLGEFEQGRPLIEALRKNYPDIHILLTFFSPSGYEVRKDYKEADWVFYLPMDGARNARLFLDIVQPVLVIFVKYEFWYYYLKKVKYRNIPLLLVSALFWEKMSFFRWYGALQRKILSRFDHLFVQDRTSAALMEGIGLGKITSISGDTRFDRVTAIAASSQPVPYIERFLVPGATIVAGSTWPDDEELLKQLIDKVPGISLIIAPHEINEAHLAGIEARFPGIARYSRLDSESKGNLILIDNIGLLSRLYRHAAITYIGGGFGRGIHNTLEAAVYGRPVIFGPVYHKFREAKELIEKCGAFSVSGDAALIELVQRLINDRQFYQKSATAAGDYVQANRGATEKIMAFIQENRLLTR